MTFLLDTVAVSELTKPTRDSNFHSWWSGVHTEQLHHSALTIAELRKGSLLLPKGPKRRRIEEVIAAILLEQGERVLPIDLAVADAWAAVAVRHWTARLTISAVDELIAATAIAHDLTVVTRNVRHFEHSGCKLLSPWSG